MRGPSASFIEALKAFRIQAAPDSARLAQHSKWQLITEVLDRWEAYEDTEILWRDISQELPGEVSASMLIGAVVLERIQLEGVARRLADVTDTIAAAKADLKRRVGREEYDVVALEAQQLAKLISARQSFSRKTKDAAEDRFMVFMAFWFEQKCGRPLHNQVATLTDIAFGGEHFAEDVREAMRRQRGRA
jgi:hypothetical protein